jgi:hypothetical protein
MVYWVLNEAGSTENELWEMEIVCVFTEYGLYGVWVVTESIVVCTESLLGERVVTWERRGELMGMVTGGAPHSLLNKQFCLEGGAVLRRCMLNRDTATSTTSSTLTVRHIVHELDQHLALASAPASLSLPCPFPVQGCVPLRSQKRQEVRPRLCNSKRTRWDVLYRTRINFLSPVLFLFHIKKKLRFPSPKYKKGPKLWTLNLQLRHGFSGKLQSHTHSNASLP